mgnify:CR=1 FL=1|jgi:hypothetical protein
MSLEITDSWADVGLIRPCNTIRMPAPISTVINVDDRSYTCYNHSLLDSPIYELRFNICSATAILTVELQWRISL